MKYNAVNNIFLYDVDFNKKDLAKIIEGKPSYEDDINEDYNDFFFELSMAVRFILSSNDDNKKTINLDTDCDIIIDDTLAVECKYIHSKSNIANSIRKARKQFEQRVSDGQAKYGYIALDLSSIISRDKVNEFAKYTFDIFVKNYESLEKKGFLKSDILEGILVDRNFNNIIGCYITNELETSLYGEVGFTHKLGINTAAIIFQSLNSFSFEYNGEVRPLTTRGMTYYLNSSLNDNQKELIKNHIHGLAVGI